MNGTSANKIVAGRLFRPATASEAVELYPHIVVGLKLGTIFISFTSSPTGPEVVTYHYGSPHVGSMAVLREDHVKLLSVAEKLPSFFLLKDRVEAAKSLISVEFSDE